MELQNLSGSAVVTEKNPCWPDDLSEDAAKAAAISKALFMLGRHADANVASRALDWQRYGPGHEQR